jgi:GNAT superfamily N-acetyltransferase
MKELHDLYSLCFDRYPISYELFCDLLKPDLGHLIRVHDNSILVGYSLIHMNSISILCVHPDYRNRGYGSNLLGESEKHILAKNYSEVRLGSGDYYLLQGVPEDESNTIRFFENRGYKAYWSSVNMELMLEGYSSNRYDVHRFENAVDYTFYDDSMRQRLLDAVLDAEESWLGIFEECVDPIKIAEVDDEIVGFQIVAPDGGLFNTSNTRVGSIGCVGVIYNRRSCGIGRSLVLRGIEWLKEQGSTAIELRYVELVDWYSTIGFYVTHTQWMGFKVIGD